MSRTGSLLAVLTLGLVLLGGVPSAFGQQGGASHAIGMLAIDEVSPEVKQAAQVAVRGPDGRGKDGPMAKVGLELSILYHQHQEGGRSGVRALRAASRAPTTEGKAARPPERRPRALDRGRVRSPISEDGQFVTVNAIASEAPTHLLSALRRLGLQSGARAGNVVSGQLPISAIREAAQVEALRGLLPSYARTHVGLAGSEADTAHRADQARTRLGVKGRGQKICALSDSYNQNASASTSASDDVQSGDLPGRENPDGRTRPIDVLDDSESSGSDEGRAMLQLIHDVAPGATLGFHTAFGGVGVFAEGIRDLANAGCTIIVDDVRNNLEPFYQDGPVSNAVDDVVENDGIPYFSSAGNSGENSYESEFRSSLQPGVVDSSSTAHDFDPATADTDVRQKITISQDGTFQVFSFQWTDPSAVVEGSAGADTDLDIALVNDTLGIVAQSALDSDTSGNGAPFEFLEYTNDGSVDASEDGVPDSTFHLVVEKATGPDPDQIKYVYSAMDARIEEYDTRGPTIFGHPVAEGAMAVAAAPFFNTGAYNPRFDSSAVLEYFSAKGGIPIRFDQSGDPISPTVRQKPEVTGTDWIDNTFFGRDLPPRLGDGDSHPNFVGTSAAAPSIAAIAALIRASRPALSPPQVYERLERSSVDITVRQKLVGGALTTEGIDSGVDPWSGHGFVRADRAVPPPSGVQISDVNATGSVRSSGNGVVTLRWRQVGEETVDEFVIEQQFFRESFTERVRVSAEGQGEFTQSIENLPIGRHTFRITGIRNDSALVTRTTSATIRENGVQVSVYPNPFRQVANLSVTLPETKTEETPVQVTVFDALGRRVATPYVSKPISDSESIQLGPRLLRSLGSGVYFFRVRGPDFVGSTKALRVR